MVNGDNLVKALANELGVEGYVQRTNNGVPDSVNAVVEIFDKQFRHTADLLEQRGDALIARGQQLKDMAAQLSQASLNVPANLRDWVQREIDMREIALSYRLVNPE